MRNLKLKSRYQNFACAEDGAVAIEYVMIATALCFAISPAFYLVKDEVIAKFLDIASFLSSS
jgi:Flp pilus assembly pilin Flp